MDELFVRYDHTDRILVHARGHRIVVDQPADHGGDDTGPTPTELFVAGLAACVLFYAERFLRRNDVDPTGLQASCRYELSTDRPARVSELRLEVTLPDGVPHRIRAALPRVMDHCTVHETLRNAPDVRIELSRDDAAA